MKIEEIRKNAPEGATHYAITKSSGNVLYYSFIYGELFVYWEFYNEWWLSSKTVEDINKI